MKSSILTVFAVMCLANAQAICGDNLVKNPELASDTSGWETIRMERGNGSSKRIKDANFISHVTDDGAAGTTGCLKISTKFEGGDPVFLKDTGVFVQIPRVSGSEDAPAILKVAFYAKAGNDATSYLYVGRLYGGGNKHKLPLTSDWQRFEVEVSAPHDTSGIIFCPTNEKGSQAVEGEVLLDEVTVENVRMAGQ
jgi:hypothetical protein